MNTTHPTKELILQKAALFLYENRGVKPSVSQMAKMGGMSKANFYYHFESKDALFEAVCDKIIDDFGNFTYRALESEDKKWYLLKNIIVDFFCGECNKFNMAIFHLDLKHIYIISNRIYNLIIEFYDDRKFVSRAYFIIMGKLLGDIFLEGTAEGDIGRRGAFLDEMARIQLDSK